jgi:hypothetical protein
MTLTIHLPDEQEAALRAKSKARGLSAEDYVRQVLAQELDAGSTSTEPFWKTFTTRMHSLPAEVFEHLPVDGASEHDHYLYGSPKRNEE